MTSEEKIKQIVGKREPFKVPEGYFEQLTRNIMDQIPEEQSQSQSAVKISLFDRVKPLLYLAACFGGLMWGIGYFVGNRADGSEETNSSLTIATSEQQTEEEIDEEYLNSANEYLLYEALYAQTNNSYSH